MWEQNKKISQWFINSLTKQLTYACPTQKLEEDKKKNKSNFLPFLEF